MSNSAHLSLCALGLCLIALSACQSAPHTQSPQLPDNPDTRHTLMPHAAPVRLSPSWRTALVDRSFSARGDAVEFSQPVAFDNDHIVVGASTGKLLLVDRWNGRVRWSFATGGRIDSRPVVREGLVFVGNDDGRMLALRPFSDAEDAVVWEVTLSSEVDGNPIINRGWIFVMTSDEVLHAIDSDSGEIMWEYQRRVPDYFTLAEVGAPLLVGDKAIVGFADGKLVALDANSGEALWIKALTGGESKFVDVDAQPVMKRGKIYAASYSGGLHALDPDTGDLVWRLEVTGASQPIVVDDTLYVTTSSRYVMAVNADTGKVRWKRRHDALIPTSPVVVNDYLLYGTTDGGIMVLDRNHGKGIVRFDHNEGFSSPITLVGPHTYALSNSGVLYGMELVLR